MTEAAHPVLAVLADALSYPDASTPALVARCADAQAWAPPEAAADLRAFAGGLAGASLAATQEQFIAAFDFDPKCTLDIGWHLFGENYDRGDFLVRLRGLLAAHGLDEGHELPDYLPQVLRLLGRLPADTAASLAAESVLPAVDKILEGLASREGPYPHLLRSVRTVVSALAHRPVEEARHV
ncbi:MAG: nitrate reductase molybdenum cofactor assembly chaperone [Acidobacteria bacterium]|nr:nitrate reductase molybdenum cofactor assembly chaperone [Acidobacteriota bacterium]